MGALFLGTSLAVLVPPFLFPSSYDLPLSFRRIFRCYVVVAVFGALLPFLVVASGLSMVPVIYWHTPLSNGMIYLCLIVGEIGLAAIVSLLMHRMDVSRRRRRNKDRRSIFRSLFPGHHRQLEWIPATFSTGIRVIATLK